jgi:uncharacterized protein YutE (UPF0331/DUF86 family)
MRYNGVIERKFSLLDTQLLQLEKHLRGVSAEEFSNNWMLKSMTERALQVSIEILIDIAERILSLENAGPAATAREAFEKLSVLGIIDSAEPFTAMTGFRNLLVHQYAEIDPGLVYKLATERIGDFRLLLTQLDKRG